MQTGLWGLLCWDLCACTHLISKIPSPRSVAAWVVAGGLAMGYQYYRNKRENVSVMDAAEIDAFNAKRKADTAKHDTSSAAAPKH